MKVTYQKIIVLLISIIFVFLAIGKFYKNTADIHISVNPEPDLEFIKKNYDALLTSEQSPSLMRAVHENGFVCYHAGLLFPWDNQISKQKDLTDLAAAWRYVFRLELNRDYYGFLFLGNPTVDSHILDAGCGGGTSAILMEQIFNCRVDGYTLAPKEVEHARATAIKHNSSDKLRFYEGDILHLAENDNTYDAIWIGEASEYISSLSELFQEMKRVGKNNTRVVLFAWCATKDSGKKLMDGLYRTTLHTIEEYLSVSREHKFELIYHQNLRDWVIPYWKFVMTSNLYDWERYFAQACIDGALDYHMICFDIQK